MSELWRRIVCLAIALVVTVGAVAVLPGCRREGPAERAGRGIDEAAEDLGEAVEEAGESIRDAAN
jgi:hypothetical protein